MRREPNLRETVPADAVREPLNAAARPRLTDDPIGDPVSSVSAVEHRQRAHRAAAAARARSSSSRCSATAGTTPAGASSRRAIFAIASITDRFDGEIARKRDLVTEFGKLADPIADKALAGAALIGLSVLGELPWWITVVMLGREVGVTVLRFWVIRHGVIPASRGGKLKTLLQAVAIGLYVLPLTGWLHTVAEVFMFAAVVLALATGFDYVARAVRLRRESTARTVGTATG